MRVVVQGILFDLDGVLVDSIAVIERHWHDFALAHDLDVKQVLGGVHGRRTVENIRHFAPHLDEYEATREFEQLEVNDVAGVCALPGAARLLSVLGQNAWAVVTSGSTAVAMARLVAAGLPIPAALITADQVTRGKPAPEGYLAGAAAIGVAPKDCLVVEDAPAGVTAGIAAGAQALALLTTHTKSELAEATIAAYDLRDVTVVADIRENASSLVLEIAVATKDRRSPGSVASYS